MNAKLLIDEINTLEKEIQASPQKDEDILDELFDFFIFSHILGVADGNEMIGESFVANASLAQAEIDRKYNGKTWRQSADEYLKQKDYVGLNKVIETTANRVYNGAIFNVGNKSDKVVGKKWITENDDRVRETHDYLSGDVVPLDKEFYTYDGDHTQFPCGFTLAQNNVNCRCHIELVDMNA